MIFNNDNLTDAKEIEEKTRQAEVVGPRLLKKISSLGEYILLSDKKKKLVIRSDNVTEVWLGKDRSLGFFSERVVELKPGEYTLYGFRDNYNETSTSFEIKHKEESKSIEISCQVKPDEHSMNQNDHQNRLVETIRFIPHPITNQKQSLNSRLKSLSYICSWYCRC